MTLAGAALATAATASAAEVYMVAHQDDWQLFAGELVWKDVIARKQIVMVYVTAGDAGYKAGGYQPTSYFSARESGAMASMYFATSNLGGWYPNDNKNSVTINGKRIHRVVHRNTTSYFLRLPDGNLDGQGFSGTQNFSLKKFRTGEIRNVYSVDGRTYYSSYQDLVNTVTKILSLTSVQCININEFETGVWSYGHSDHREVSRLAHAAFNYGTPKFRLFKDYEIAQNTTPISQGDMLVKSGLFASYVSQMSQSQYNQAWDAWHASFLPNATYREVSAPFFPNLN